MFDIDKYRANKKVKVLLVEDDETLGKIYQKSLERQGYKVSLAMEGRNVFKILNTKKFHVIILDLMLPDISGLEVLEYLQNQGNKGNIIVLTNTINEKMQNNCSKLSICGYLSKSDYTPLQIVEYIERNLLKTENG